MEPELGLELLGPVVVMVQELLEQKARARLEPGQEREPEALAPKASKE